MWGGVWCDAMDEPSSPGAVRSRRERVTVSAVQATPVFLDRAGTLQVAREALANASGAGADLVVFPESFVPGYPDWVWRRPPMSDGDWYARFYEQAVDITGGD